MLVDLAKSVPVSVLVQPIAPNHPPQFTGFNLSLHSITTCVIFRRLFQPAMVSTHPPYPVLQVFFTFDDAMRFCHLRAFRIHSTVEPPEDLSLGSCRLLALCPFFFPFGASQTRGTTEHRRTGNRAHLNDSNTNTILFTKRVRSHEACHDKMAAHLYWGSGSFSQPRTTPFSRGYLELRRWMQSPRTVLSHHRIRPWKP
ncbi:hypothetical protein BDM02DRAFT_700016 [Thelephora ganbajun]|uniref:Uncharacterized protein n=1 Tax=Thelephora ganbajun TaxID=370292 RepID=A0ACB6Z5W4_THEGA|nr:hypothetical protein BDM02DRAFT_700016 [Thelephora ganbajun]